MEKSLQKNVGPILGTLIVIIVLIAAALYVFASHINHQAQTSSIASSTITVYMHDNGDDVQTLKNDLNDSVK